MIRIFSSNKRKISTVTLVAFLLQVFYPAGAYALTGGPSQPEFESFEPAGATEMVNLATGDFIYNIPLMDIDGYPINISYHGGVNMEQEASWVGLGWSLSPGAINRGMRGLPDDFNGGSDIISEQIHMKENKTYGLKVGGGVEVAGFDFASLGASMGYGIQYNTYKGLGLEVEIGVSGALTASQMGASGTVSGGLGLKISNQDGADFSMAGGIGVGLEASYGGIGVGGSLGINRSKTNNSRRGIESDIISGSASAGVSVKGVGFGTGTGSSINLIPNTAYSPNMQFPTSFSGITGEIHGGGELYWVNIHGYTRAYIFKQGIAGSVFSREAYGYLNLENSKYSSLLDFNRDNDGVYYLESPKLPFANLTYDLFNANAQGLNELFRPYRNDVGFVHDNIVSSGGTANDIGIEANYGQLFEMGFNNYSTNTNSTSGPWLSSNNALGQGVSFKGDNQLANEASNFKTYEHAYFKALDELPIEDQTFYNSILGKDLSSFELSPIGGTNVAILKNNIRNSSGGSSLYTGQTKTKREARNTNFSFLNVKEATKYALDKEITSYNSNVFVYYGNGELNKSSTSSQIERKFESVAANHHISEVTVLKEDGARYIYGIPVYNKKQKEVVFNVEGHTNNSVGTVTYTGADNSPGNTRGIDQFFLSKNTSAYAHSYLLTGLLSSDYVDIEGDGLTPDDYGDYTKFNYSRVSSDYHWRNPCTNYLSSDKEALFDPQWRADSKDDKGIYIYGEKELWYTHSIETKNYIAEFHTSIRDDARGVIDENGIADATDAKNKSYKLDKIILYSKKDLSTPIKTVNFSYKYTLCQGTPNSIVSTDNPNQGKLTLDKIYFTYGKSDKSVFSPYEFKYCDFDHDGTIDSGLNPSYNRTEMDRWGNYKQKPAGSTMENIDFPYTIQNKLVADKSSSVWSLSSVVTPAKSRIDVYFESDDYSHIQSQVPGQMMKMVEFLPYKPIPGYLPINSTSADLYQSNLLNPPYAPKNYMIVDLSGLKEGGLLANNITDAESILRNKMLPGNNRLYFKGFVQLGNGSGTQEYVPGYSQFDAGNSGILTTNAVSSGTKMIYKYAFIKLNDVDIEDPKNYAGDNCNPISKAAWQITRLYHPRIAYPGSEPGGNTLSACAGLMSALTEVFSFKEKNNRLRKKSYGRYINPTKSFVRLNIPTKSKFGGGHRVSKIEIVDNWNSMVNNESTTTYGQTYNYTKDDNGQLISSGVASYEPLTGGDEISLRSPIEYSVNRVAAPNDAHFSEYPIGEAFYPASTIIYSKITVRNLDRKDNANEVITGNIGRTEYEFYTSKDFPIYGDYSALQSYVHTPDPWGDLFSNTIESSVHLSQGSILRLNNMHGKLKSVLTFQEGNNNAISGIKYFYKTLANGKELDNSIPVIDEAGVISTNIIGQHVEALGDFRSQNTTTYANTIGGNLNTTLVTLGPIIFPLPIPSIFWGNTTDTRDFNSATFNKVVTQQAILERVETISNYATSTTENLVWDAKTTDVILSRTTTNFKDFDYEYSTPAHWVYQGMGGAFNNIGYGFKNPISSTNIIDPSTGIINLTSGLLTPGDEVALEFTNNLNQLSGLYNDRLWITKDNVTGQLLLVNRTGKICNTTGGTGTINVFASAPSGTANYVLKVIRSGYKNILDETAENIAFSKDPRVGGTSINLTNNILDASATEYSEDWSRYYPIGDSYLKDSILPREEEFCLGDYKEKCSLSDFVLNINQNPYILNTKGNWTEKRSYSYLGKRLSENGTGTVDIRQDGTFETYKPFFSYSNGSWKEVYNKERTSDYNSVLPFANWIMNSEATLMSSHGNMVEAKDAINRYSSSLFGYNHTLKTAMAVNAKYREIGYDNFEDYTQNDCSENHFSFINFLSSRVNTTAHTGRYSMKINSGNCLTVTKLVLEPDYENAFGSNNHSFVNFPALATETNPKKIPALQPNSNSTNYWNTSYLSEFAPQAKMIKDQKFILSLWIKEAQLNKDGDYVNTFADVFLDGNLISTLVKKSSIINGWQKLDYEFLIPANTPFSLIYFMIKNNGTTAAYFDDIRIQPFNATMETYVYDPKSFRIWAQLDERNFATIYEYDNEGVLVRVKKETEKGINTIQETRNSFKKQ